MLELIVSLGATAALVPFVRRALEHYGLVDVPNHRSSHSAPVPRGGGAACMAGVLVGATAAAAAGHRPPWFLIGTATFLAVVGMLDDRRSLSPILRLGSQIAVGVLMGVAVGGGRWMLVGALTVPVVVNVINFMDGINGITGLNMGLWGAVAVAAGTAEGVVSLLVIGGVCAGAAFGFLPWNAPKARVFLGDVGSYLFGGLVASGILIGWTNGVPRFLLIAPLSIYLADTGSVIVKRVLRRESLLEAHREHAYQRLTSQCGFPHFPIAVMTVLLAAIVTVSWTVSQWWISTSVSAIVCIGYLYLPHVAMRALVTAGVSTTPSSGQA